MLSGTLSHVPVPVSVFHISCCFTCLECFTCSFTCVCASHISSLLFKLIHLSVCFTCLCASPVCVLYLSVCFTSLRAAPVCFSVCFTSACICFYLSVPFICLSASSMYFTFTCLCSVICLCGLPACVLQLSVCCTCPHTALCLLV